MWYTVRTTRTFCLDLPLCREASNYFSLHPSRRFSSTSRHHSMFDQLLEYGKTAATVWTMWILVQTRSSIMQVAHSKFKHPEDDLYSPNVRASYMEIAYIRSTVWMTGQHLLDAAQFRKEFLRNLESRSHSCPSGRFISTVQMAPRYFMPHAHLNLQPINRGP
jgi:hypothetical protein